MVSMRRSFLDRARIWTSGLVGAVGFSFCGFFLLRAFFVCGGMFSAPNAPTVPKSWKATALSSGTPSLPIASAISAKDFPSILSVCGPSSSLPVVSSGLSFHE